MFNLEENFRRHSEAFASELLYIYKDWWFQAQK